MNKVRSAFWVGFLAIGIVSDDLLIIVTFSTLLAGELLAAVLSK